MYRAIITFGIESRLYGRITKPKGQVVTPKLPLIYRRLSGQLQSMCRADRDSAGTSNMSDPKYKVFAALDPFFDIVQRGLAGHVEGDHYFDTLADNAIFEYRYIVPGWPQRVDGREVLMALYAGYGNNILLHGADGLVVHKSQDPRVVILEYDVHGKIVRTGATYDNRFISVITIMNRKIVYWRDYMDSLAAMNALSQK